MKFKPGDHVTCNIYCMGGKCFKRSGTIVESGDSKYHIEFDNKMLWSKWVEEKDLIIDVQDYRERRLYELLEINEDADC